MSNLPPRLVEALADRYQIESELGAGGMATVYLARDLKHDRQVAVKVLRPELAAVIGGERFLAEIRTTANLQHPHILPLFDSGEADSFLWYVMPHIAGENLRQRIEREGQLGVEEAVSIARDVAEALDYAHRQEIIHRDIKPANILLHDGNPLVADFGIALAISAAGGGRMTETGLSLGTPHYMSPEQASADRDLTPRSDVYSLGCVLYEMLAGQPPHTGPSAQSVLVRILTETPRPVTDERRSVPSHVAAAVSKAIEKLPADRFASAQEFGASLEDRTFSYAAPATSRSPATAGANAPGASRNRRWLLGGVAAVILSLMAFAGGVGVGLGDESDLTPAPAMAFVMFDSVAPTDQPIVGPGGSVGLGNRRGIYLRAPGAVDQTTIELAANNATFSPDGASMAFVTFGAANETMNLMRRPLAGGPSQLLLSLDINSRRLVFPFWATDGFVYAMIFDPETETGDLVRVPEGGGEAEVLFSPEEGLFVAHPVVTPDASVVFFSLIGGRGGPIIALDLVSGDTVTVVADERANTPQWLASGHLAYGNTTGAVFGVPFDLDDMRPTGDPVPLLDDVQVANLQTKYSVSPSGTLVYITSSVEVGVPATGDGYTFAIRGEGGDTEPIQLEITDHMDASVSPDGRELAYVRDGQIWLYDLDTGFNRALSARHTEVHNPRWSPDGDRVAFVSYDPADEESAIEVQSVGSEASDTIATPLGRGNPSDWTADGTLLFYVDDEGREDIFSVPVDGSAPPTTLLQADWVEEKPAVSPDGRWIAYITDRTGEPRLYIRSWPELEGEQLVPLPDEGDFFVASSYPLWSPDGDELYFDVAGGVVAVTVSESGDISDPRVTGIRSAGLLMDVHPDGRLLIANRGSGETEERVSDEPSKLIVIANWLSLVRERFVDGG